MNLAGSISDVGQALAQGAAILGDEDDLAQDMALLRSAGWLTACLPPSHGGEGWGTDPDGALPAFEALRQVGRANLSAARLFEGHMNALKILNLYASTEVLDETAQAVRQGTLLGVWGADEPDNPLSVGHKVDHLVLQGSKRYASGLGLVGQAVVTTNTTGGEPQLLLVRTDDADRADRSTWTMSGMQATRSGRYDFTGVEVARRCLIGQPGDLLREPHFEGGIWRYCAAQFGAAERLHLEMCDVLVAQDRHRDSHQQRRIADSAMAIEIMRLWLTRCAVKVEQPGATAAATALALFARDVTESRCRLVICVAEQALGMAAHVVGTPVDRFRRDLGLFLCQAQPDAKRARAVETLLGRGRLVEEL